jgi:hypothetical protein
MAQRMRVSGRTFFERFSQARLPAVAAWLQNVLPGAGPNVAFNACHPCNTMYLQIMVLQIMVLQIVWTRKLNHETITG